AAVGDVRMGFVRNHGTWTAFGRKKIVAIETPRHPRGRRVGREILCGELHTRRAIADRRPQCGAEHGHHDQPPPEAAPLLCSCAASTPPQSAYALRATADTGGGGF